VAPGYAGRSQGPLRRIVAFSQTDFTEDLERISVPVLVMHGGDDQIVPYADSGPLSAKLVQNGTLETRHGFPHGMPTTQAETINADLLAWLRSGPQAPTGGQHTRSRLPGVAPRHTQGNSAQTPRGPRGSVALQPREFRTLSMHACVAAA
jgi:dienelactone hydrolase